MPLTFDDIKQQDTSDFDSRETLITEVHVKYNKIRDAKVAHLSEQLELLLDLLAVAKNECNFGDYARAEVYLKKYHELDKKFDLRNLKSAKYVRHIKKITITRWDEELKKTADMFCAMAQQEHSNGNGAQALNLVRKSMLLQPKTLVDAASKEVVMQKSSDYKQQKLDVALVAKSMGKSGVISAAGSAFKKCTNSSSPKSPTGDLVEVALGSPKSAPTFAG